MISKMIHDMASWVVSAFLLWGAWRNCPICLGILQNCYEKFVKNYERHAKLSVSKITNSPWDIFNFTSESRIRAN